MAAEKASKARMKNRSDFIPLLSLVAVFRAKRQTRFADPEAVAEAGEDAAAAVTKARLRLVPWTDEANRSRKPAVEAGEPLQSAFGRAEVGITQLKYEFVAEALRQPLRGQRAIPARRTDPRARAGEEIVPHIARGAGDAERVRRRHLAVIGSERVPIGRERGGREAKEGGESLGLGVIGFEFLRRQCSQRSLIRQHGALDQRRVNPAQRGDLVGLVVRAAAVGRDFLGDLAADARVQRIEMAGGGKRLVAAAEDHGEYDAECIVKAGNGPGEDARVLGERGGDPRMRKLQNGRAAGSEKERRLAIDLPAGRPGAEDAGGRVGRSRLNRRKQSFVLSMSHVPDPALGRRRRHSSW